MLKCDRSVLSTTLCRAVVLADREETPILLEGFCSVAIFTLWAFRCQGNPSGFGLSGSGSPHCWSWMACLSHAWTAHILQEHQLGHLWADHPLLFWDGCVPLLVVTRACKMNQLATTDVTTSCGVMKPPLIGYFQVSAFKVSASHVLFWETSCAC